MQVSRFVLGCAPLGGLFEALDDAGAEATLAAAWAAGVRHFDTAPHYGAGLSERRLGAFLAQLPRDSFTVSTKVGRLLVDPDVVGPVPDEGFFGADRKVRVLDYSVDGVRRSLEESLQRMGLDRIDVAYIHDPDDHMDQAIDEAYPALHQLRAAGVVAHIGAGMNATAPLVRLVRETEADMIMLAGRFTLLDHSAADVLLPLCLDRDVAVVAAGVYNSGVLADPRPGATYDYTAVPTAVVDRALVMQRICAAYGVPLRAAAVQFPMRHPAVTSVAVGARSGAQVRDNLAMIASVVPEPLWAELAAA